MANNTVLPSDQTTLSPSATKSSPSVPKASKKRSWVWDHFKEVQLSDPKAKKKLPVLIVICHLLVILSSMKLGL